MNALLIGLITAIGSFFAAMLIAPAVVRLAGGRAVQTLLGYVKQHENKAGTPTFGGIIFILSTTIAAAAAGAFSHELGRMLMLVFLGYGLIGFTDDFIKVKLKRNKGLTAWQKILFQVVAGFLAAWFSYRSPFVGSAVSLNFCLGEWDLGVWYLPFATFVFVAMSNAVNLTDGLDALAGGTGGVYVGFFALILAVIAFEAEHMGMSVYADEVNSMFYTSMALLGGLLAFLWFNAPKASIFMGDTGSLALGAFFAALALFSKNPLIGAVIGIMYVVSCISVIIQVVSFKLTKKRVFLMSPYHHHLELKGIPESKITARYMIATFVAGLVALCII